MDVEYEVQAVVNHWGGADMVNILGSVYNHNRFDSTDAPILIVHGTEDDVSPFSNAEALVELYASIGVHNELVVLEGKGHGTWNATVDGKTLAEISLSLSQPN